MEIPSPYCKLTMTDRHRQTDRYCHRLKPPPHYTGQGLYKVLYRSLRQSARSSYNVRPWYRASTSRDVLVYSPSFTVTDWASPWGMARLSSVSKVSIYTAHSRKTNHSNVLSKSRQYFATKVSFQLTPENAETQSWVTKTVWQRIPGRRARNRTHCCAMAINHYCKLPSYLYTLFPVMIN